MAATARCIGLFFALNGQDRQLGRLSHREQDRGIHYPRWVEASV